MSLVSRGAEALPLPQPAFGARDGASFKQKLLLLFLLLALAATLIFAPRPGLWLAIAFCPLFLGLIIVQLGAALEPLHAAQADATAGEPATGWPTYTVLVPLYREAAVAAQLIRAIERLDYPAERLQVLLLLETDDRATRAALETSRYPPFVRLAVVRDGYPRTKPRALNAGLALATGELICVFDAEDIPEPDQLKRAAAMFASAEPDVLCLQATLTIDNSRDGWLPTMLAIEYAALFDVIKGGLANAGLPLPLGGTSNHFRRASLIRLGGWDAWNVTEDADLGLSIARANGRVLALPSRTFEEAPVTFSVWLGQRRRWLKGWMQTGIRHGRQPRLVMAQMGLLGWTVAMLQVGGIAVGALTYPFFGLWVGWNLWTGEILKAEDPLALVANSLAIGTLLAGLACMFAPAMIGLFRQGAWRLMPWVPTLPVYQLLISAAAWLALADLLRQPFQWVKTQHGRGTRRIEKSSAGPTAAKTIRSRP